MRLEIKRVRWTGRHAKACGHEAAIIYRAFKLRVKNEERKRTLMPATRMAMDTRARESRISYAITGNVSRYAQKSSLAPAWMKPGEITKTKKPKHAFSIARGRHFVKNAVLWLCFHIVLFFKARRIDQKVIDVYGQDTMYLSPL